MPFGIPIHVSTEYLIIKSETFKSQCDVRYNNS